MLIGPESWEWWWEPWRDRIRCGSCGGIMDLKWPCPVCKCDYRDLKPSEHEIKGQLAVVPPAFAGALDWSPYVMLKLMHREWMRPIRSEEVPDALPESERPSARILFVIVFWTYFETLMGWFYEMATKDLPGKVGTDLLERHRFIGAGVTRLHKILFGTTYGDDLEAPGFTAVSQCLENVQRQRNAFMHGQPAAISKALTEQTAQMIPQFHEAWIRSFNSRCAKKI